MPPTCRSRRFLAELTEELQAVVRYVGELAAVLAEDE